MNREPVLTKKDCVKGACRWSLMAVTTFNYDTQLAPAVVFGIGPLLRKIYPDDDEYVEALNNHFRYFNTHPWVANLVLGATLALEDKEGISAADAVQNIKVSLMGPLAGVGDPLVWGTLRPITAALGASLALSGNILGPLLFFFIFNAVRLAMKWYGLQLGFRKGVNIVSDMGGNLLQKLTEGASILGLFVMGVLVTKWTTINVPLVVSQTPGADGATVTMTVQNILDQLCPGLLALGLTLLMVRLLNKKVNPVWLIFALFGLGIIGNALGFLS